MGAKRKIPVRYTTNKHGQRRAQYWFGMQWRPLAMIVAKMMIENGDAELMPIVTRRDKAA